MNRFGFIAGNNPKEEPDDFKPKMIFSKIDGEYYVTLNLREKLIDGWMCGVRRRHKDDPRPSYADRKAGRNKLPFVDEVVSVCAIKNEYHRMINRQTGKPFDGVE